MRKTFCAVIEEGRDRRDGPYASKAGDDYGSFRLRAPTGAVLTVIACAGDADEFRRLGSDVAWDHVSVSTPNRTPSWAEMDWVKRLFFADDECAVQFHPPVADHINVHEFTLHLFRSVGMSFPMPPKCVV